MFANPSRQPGNLGFDPLSLSTPKNRYKYELAEVRPTLTRTMNPEPAIMRLKILQCYMCHDMQRWRSACGLGTVG